MLPMPSKPPASRPRSNPDEPLPSFDTASSTESPLPRPPSPASTIPPQPRSSLPGYSPGASSGPPRWASAPPWAGVAGEALRGRLPLPVRDRMQRYPGAKVLAVSGAAALAFIGLFVTAGGLLYRTLRTSDAHQALTDPSPAQQSAREASSPPPREPSRPPDPARAAHPAPDEATVLLGLAESLLAQHRDAEVPALLQRLVARRPELAHDERLQRSLLAAAASDDRRAAAEALALLTGAMGETGAALVYELAFKSDVREPLRQRAQAWLASKDFERTAPLAVYAAAKLRAAKSCEDKHGMLDFAAQVGGKYVLAALHELEGQTSCKPDDLVHCQPCLRNDSKLSDTIQTLERELR
ncbi:MAG TPA: hypothetical protein VGQ57_00595 [Polyangiaceae bacterium]|nr:hypothetical protein [Polyangiaceae bacterium]